MQLLETLHDILMLCMSGFEVLKEIRAFSLVPVIVFTANPRFAEEAIGLGADGYIGKPFDPDELVEKIRSFLC